MTFIAATSTAQNFSSSVTVSVPAGVADGDVLVACLAMANDHAITVPSGWTLVREDRTSAGAYAQSVLVREASSEPASYNFAFSGSGDITGIILAYRDVGLPTTADAVWAGSGGSAIFTNSVDTPQDGLTVIYVSGIRAETALGTPLTSTQRASVESVSGHLASVVAADKVVATAGASGGGGNVSHVGGSAYWFGQTVALGSANNPPSAPILTAPANGSTIDRNSVQRFALTPSDPDVGDSTSKTYWRYRLIGAPSWTTVTQTLPQTYYDFAAGTFAAGDYEWQGATKDAQGAPANDADLKYSASSFFTAATAPESPTITAPINGATVSNTATVTWSTPDQDAYQVRRVADNAGAPNTAAVYYDSGEVVTTTARSRDLTFATNNRYEHIQVRQKRDGLWSSWASIRVLVSFTPPTTPVVTLTPDAATGSLLVGITNPAPGAGVPATSYNDVYVDDGDGEERKAAMLAPNTAWTYWTPVSGREYDGSVRVTAVGDNGTTASS